ncbi:MAG: hypothetical protein PHY47_16115 [Lachnospiraceae bacterium]|nr:hypothetical protein [Lachnospiraceae bacterium]
MQKVEIIIEGPDEEKCAELINDLANATMKHYRVAPVNIFCGRAPVKKNFAGLQIPAFMCKGAFDERSSKQS